MIPVLFQSDQEQSSHLVPTQSVETGRGWDNHVPTDFHHCFSCFAIVIVGFFYGRRHAPDMAAANKLNLDVFTPALIFHVLSGKDFHIEVYQELALAAILVILGSGLLV